MNSLTDNIIHSIHYSIQTIVLDKAIQDIKNAIDISIRIKVTKETTRIKDQIQITGGLIEKYINEYYEEM